MADECQPRPQGAQQQTEYQQPVEFVQLMGSIPPDQFIGQKTLQPDFKSSNQGTPSFTFPQAISHFFSNLFDFNGRDRKSAYWWPILLLGLLWFISWILMLQSLPSYFSFDKGLNYPHLGFFYFFEKVVSLVVVLFLLGATIRRLHDNNNDSVLAWITGGSAIFESLLCISCIEDLWNISWYFWFVWFISQIILITLCCHDSTHGPNKYGPSEKYPI